MIFYLISIGIIISLIVVIGKLLFENHLTKNANAISVELFPTSDIYKSNINEDLVFIPATKKDSSASKLAIRNRGSVRIFEGNYFSPQEYSDFKKAVMSKELP